MVRKSYLSFLLPILLVLAQQGAMLHELGHLCEGLARPGLNESRQSQDQKQVPDAPCKKCVAFAHLNGAIAPDIPVFLQQPVANDFSWQEAVAQRTTDLPTARSRGPPVVL